MLTFLGFIAVLIVSVPSPTEAECRKRGPTQQYAVRVVNGQDAAPNSWPWQISLRHTKYGHICGGSLIEKDVILTAAQCVTFEPDPASFKVVVGAHNLEGSPTSVQETINVAKVTYHSGFNPTTMENDLALLKLEKSITSSDKVNTVCLPKSRTDQISAGTYCYLTGWGRTASTGGAATVLQQALLPVVDYTTCNSRNHVLGKIFKESMLCAGGNRKGGCQGDNGGPLVCEENGKWVLRGAVSWGHPYCQTDYYSVFTRVSNYVEWIKKKLP